MRLFLPCTGSRKEYHPKVVLTGKLSGNCLPGILSVSEPSIRTVGRRDHNKRKFTFYHFLSFLKGCVREASRRLYQDIVMASHIMS